MKRSEMIKLMTYTYASLHRGGQSEMSDEERMSEILKVMEQEGILPPPTLKITKAEGTLNKVKGIMYVNEQVHEWDDEDPEPNYGEP